VGIYDTVGSNNIQIKLLDSSLHHFNIGDKIEVQDGLYIGLDGWFTVKNGTVSDEGTVIFDKWGNQLNCGEIIQNRSEVVQAISRWNIPGE